MAIIRTSRLSSADQKGVYVPTLKQSLTRYACALSGLHVGQDIGPQSPQIG